MLELCLGGGVGVGDGVVRGSLHLALLTQLGSVVQVRLLDGWMPPDVPFSEMINSAEERLEGSLSALENHSYLFCVGECLLTGTASSAEEKRDFCKPKDDLGKGLPCLENTHLLWST